MAEKSTSYGRISSRLDATGLKKCAMFLTILGTETTGEIMKYLKEEEIEQIIPEIAFIKKIEPEEKEEILEEFAQLMTFYRTLSFGGVDAAKAMLEGSLGTQKAADILNRLASSMQSRPFEHLRRTDPSQLLNFIQSEHPQTIALILSNLEPQNAAFIMSELDPELRPTIARRIANMDRTSPETLKQVERILEQRLSEVGSSEFDAAGGIEATVEILNISDRATEKRIIEALEDEDPELAEEIKKRMFVFEDIVLLDDRSIQKVLREIDQSELAKALKAVDAEVQEKIYRNMSKRAGALLKEDMDFMGPIRLKDVEESQQRIVNIIRKLEEQGEIVIARGGEEEIVL
jgi:flagellar motor switch protein FliG